MLNVNLSHWKILGRSRTDRISSVVISPFTFACWRRREALTQHVRKRLSGVTAIAMFACQTRLRRIRTALLLLACSLLVTAQHTHARTLGESRQVWQHTSVPSSNNVERTSLSAESETQPGHDELHSILSHEVASSLLDASIETAQLESLPQSQVFAIQAEPASMLDMAQEPLWGSADPTRTPTGGLFEAAADDNDEVETFKADENFEG